MGLKGGGLRTGGLRNLSQIEVSDIPDIVDNFEESLYEDQGFTLSDYYSGDLPAFSRTTASPVYEGSYSLKANTTTTSFPNIYSSPGDGLNYYPQRGDRILLSASLTDSAGRIVFGFFAEGSGDTTSGDGYVIQIRDGSVIDLERRDSGSGTVIASDSISVQANTEYEIDISSDASTISVDVRDVPADSVVASASTTDDTYSGRGVNFQSSTTSTDPETIFDNVRIV